MKVLSFFFFAGAGAGAGAGGWVEYNSYYKKIEVFYDILHQPQNFTAPILSL